MLRVSRGASVWLPWVFVGCMGRSGLELPPDERVFVEPSADAGGESPPSETACSPGEIRDCYSGPVRTQDVGACHAGTSTCAPDGSGFAPCTGEVLPHPEDCITRDDEDCDGRSTDDEDGCGPAQVCHPWSVGIGGDGLDFGSDVTSDAAGNAIAIGSIIDTAIVADQSFAAGGWSDVFLVKIGPIGGVVWAKAFGNEHAQLGHSIAADGAGNILLMTWSSSGIDFGGGLVSEHTQLAKLGPSGEHQWSMGYPNAMPPWESHSLAVGGAGQLAFAVIGDGLTSVDLGGGAKSGTLLVAQLDATGQHQWSRAFGGRPPHGTPIYASVAIDPDDNVIVTGSLYDTIDFGGGPLTSAGGSDVFVAKFDSLGQHLYSRRFGDASTQDSTDIAVADIDGNIVVGGLFVQGELDFGGGPLVADGWSAFLVELDPMGDHVWSKSFPVDGFPAGRGVAAGTAGDVLMAGGFSGIMDLGGGPVTSSDGDFDIYVARFDTMGYHLHSAQFGSARRWQLAYGAAAGSTGGVLLTGYFDDEIDFGTGLLETRGNDDAFMAQLCR